MTYRYQFAVSSYDNPIGDLCFCVRGAVKGAREAVGSAALLTAWEQERGILGHIYTLSFATGEHELHPLQLENTVYQLLRPTLEERPDDHP